MVQKRIDHDRVRQLAASINPDTNRRYKHGEIAGIVDCHPRYVGLIVKGRLRAVDRQRDPAKPNPKPYLTRMEPPTLRGHIAHRLPSFDAPPIVEGRTVYPSTVHNPADGEPILKSGMNNSKIGRMITKGKWAGFPIVTLTLEERATCPRSCNHWRSCYGNTMQLASRMMAGPALEAGLRVEIARMSAIHRKGFAVRLHVLGDFYSVAYVQMWADLLDRHPPLHVFGFTARWNAQRDPIARVLIDLTLQRWDRFAMRFSDAPIDECATVSIEYPGHKPDDAVICPQQLGKTQTCGTCALCWHSKRRIAFIQH